MDNIIITLRYNVNLDRGVVRQRLPVEFGTGDKEAHKIILTACRAAGVVDLTGAGVMAYVNRNDGTSVVVDGSVEDGKAVVLLPEACYAVNGAVSIVVKLTMDETRATALWLDGHINRTSNGEVVDPGDVVPSLETLLAEIDNMRTATSEATQAASDAQTAITATREEAQEAISGAAADAQAAITKTSTDAQTAIANAEMAAAQAVNGNAPPIVQTAQGTYIESDDAADNRVFPKLSAFGRSTQSGEPTPDSPADITNIGDSGSITVKVYGQNLFPGGDVSEVVFTGSSGEEMTRWGYAIRLPAGTYTMWAIPQEGASGGFLYGSRNNASGEYVGSSLSLVANGILNTRTVTVDEGDVIYLYEGNGNSQPNAIRLFGKYAVQIVAGTEMVEGDLAITGGSVTISTPDGLRGIPVSTGGSYTDAADQQWLADEIDLVRCVHIQRIGKVVMDGVTAGRMAASKSNNTKVNTYNIGTDDWGRAIGTDVVLTVSHYPYHGTAGGSGYVTMDGVMICDVPGSMYVGHNSIATLEDFNAWLAAQHAAGTPVTVLYPLAEPVETPLTGDALAAAARLCSLYPVTTITAEGAWIVSKYVADTKAYIDKKFAELATQLIDA